ncbi:hypothetical protein H0A36_25880 [Endozoicomonas sp. SM1973]|uniref:Uncharacterized protein n=1 Tax=Spartinivicinus marinus TaxID=2994442 RepID=A0A853I6B0_9GAMM|nr:hypothetical protein [Spartinivicinus marinus]MCX4027889.1 hypothetical protein [Spartinivicinus marinus]NYZ69450.1 hypothetical protein [Spartinivicinus marinus]
MIIDFVKYKNKKVAKEVESQKQNSDTFIPSEPITKNGSLLEDPNYAESFQTLLNKANKLDW